jgi:hypothetical protein
LYHRRRGSSRSVTARCQCRKCSIEKERADERVDDDKVLLKLLKASSERAAAAAAAAAALSAKTAARQKEQEATSCRSIRGKRERGTRLMPLMLMLHAHAAAKEGIERRATHVVVRIFVVGSRQHQKARLHQKGREQRRRLPPSSRDGGCRQ